MGEDLQPGILLRKGVHEPFPQEYSQLRVFTHENILPLLAVIAYANTIQVDVCFRKYLVVKPVLHMKGFVYIFNKL